MDTLLPAAQYLRMSTDHQQYSLDNQTDAIARYASLHGFDIVRTYSDSARSGLRLKNRAGLKQLLKDVMEGQRDFFAVLVYDVSRWGRFQDTDEAAHYEFLCKSAGVPVHYCAEIFGNDNSLFDMMIKSLKRTMAGEYSRELSVKVRAGLVRLAGLGYKLGGSPPYGLRRQLLDSGGTPKQLLLFGQRKSLANEHVTFVPGPDNEIGVVERIFEEFADQGRSVNSIADRLNTDGIPYLHGRSWKGDTIRVLLQDTHYIGMQVWGRTTAILAGPVKRLPFRNWVISQDAFPSIIPLTLFVRAQHVFANFTNRLSDEQMLERLRRVYKEHGKLSSDLIDHSPLCPCTSAYVRRFGGLLSVYERLGYDSPGQRSYISLRQRGAFLRNSLVQSVLDAFPNQFQEVRKNRRCRVLLRYRKTGLLISFIFARRTKTSRSWIIDTPREERKRTTLLALLDLHGSSIDTLCVFPSIPTEYKHLRVRKESGWFQSGTRVRDVSEFLQAVTLVRASSKG